MVDSYPGGLRPPAPADSMATVQRDLAHRLARLGARAGDIATFRSDALALLRGTIAFDAALFHELSPRVPLERGAVIGFELPRIAATVPRWDELAVVFDRLREHAMAREGVTTLDEALPIRSRARRAWDARIGRPLHAPDALLAHLIVDERIISAILLVRRGGSRFAAPDAEVMRALAPVLAIADGLHQMRADQKPRGLVSALRCEDQRLTERQRELVQRVALGHTDAEIGRALDISANTVRNHLVEIRRRLGAANRAEIVRLAVLR